MMWGGGKKYFATNIKIVLKNVINVVVFEVTTIV